MTHVAEALSTALLHFIWQGLAAGVVFGVVLLTMRKGSANSRYVASCVVLAVLALAPVITGVLAWQAAAVPLKASSGSPGNFSIHTVSTEQIALPATLLGNLSDWILPLWTAGVFVFTLRLAWAAGHASSLRRRGVEADSAIQAMIEGLAERLGIRRKLRVLMSSVAEVPSVVGWLRPVILLPAAVVVGLTPQQLESLLAHELAHIRRYDYFVNILQMVVETLLFYHPVVWWVSSRIRYERELCCDDLAVRSCGDALSYARALAQLEKLRPIGPSLIMGSAHGPLFHRIQRLLERGKSEHVPSRLACAAGLLTGLLCLGWFMSARAQQREPLPAVKELGATLQELPPIPPLPPLPPVAPIVAAPVGPAASPAVAAPVGPAASPTLVSPVGPAASPALVAPVASAASPTLVSPMPPAAPVAPVAPAPAAPIRVPPQDPARTAQDLFSILSLLEGLSQFPDARWVLFRGNAITARGSAADEEQAKRARVPFTGDLLWFQLDGKTYVTQDKDVMDRIQASGTGTDSRFTAAAQDLAQAQRRLAEAESRRRLAEAQSQSQLADQNRALQELQSSLERINRNLANSTGPNRNPQQTELEGIRSEVSRLQALSAQMQAITAQSEAELRARQSELEAMRGRNELSAVREAEILRGAVREGKAQPTP